MILDKQILPCSIEAENAILGAILHDSGGRPYELALESEVSDEHFTAPYAKVVWNAMTELQKNGYPIDPITLVERLRTEGRLELAGGMQMIQSLLDNTPTSAHAEYYLRILCDKYLKRVIINQCDKAKDDAIKGDLSAEMIRAEQEIEFAKMTPVSVMNSRSLSDIAGKAFKDWEDNAHGVSQIGIQTGIGWLDDATAGVMRQAYWVISGRPGSCKSTLCRQIAENIARRGHCVSIKTTEKTEEQYIGDMIAAEAEMSVHKLNCAGFPVERIKFLNDARMIVERWPVLIDSEMVTRPQLSTWYKKSVAKGSVVNIYDYIQDTIPSSKYEAQNPEQKMTLTTQEMRRLSKTTGTPTIVVSTESNDGALRYSGQTEYDATVWLRMRKADDYCSLNNPHYIAEIKKSRSSPAGTEISLFYYYGKLLDRDAYDTKISMIHSRTF